jgi:hypothetical protein
MPVAMEPTASPVTLRLVDLELASVLIRAPGSGSAPGGVSSVTGLPGGNASQGYGSYSVTQAEVYWPLVFRQLQENDAPGLGDGGVSGTGKTAGVVLELHRVQLLTTCDVVDAYITVATAGELLPDSPLAGLTFGDVVGETL